MQGQTLPTQFAPAERACVEEVYEDSALFKDTLLGATLESLPIGVLVLNKHRQIVFCNQRFCILTPPGDEEKVLGLRPGEALGCIHAKETQGGCGTTAFCRHCGAAQAIISAMRGLGGVQLCHILRNGEDGLEALDLQIHATPYEHEGSSFVLFSAIDVSSEQRLRAMERIFFHDVLNTASGLVGVSEVMEDELSGEQKGYMAMLGTLAEQLVEEIHNQKDLSAAERGELVAAPKPFMVSAMARSIVDVWCKRRECSGIALKVADLPDPDVLVTADPVLVRRVVVNMVKNALEASEEGDTVSLGVEAGPGELRVWVSNPAAMPEEVQRQVFNRFYTTKGPGRGLGTYGMRLLAERYLGGRVEFESDPGVGTVFRLHLPVD